MPTPHTKLYVINLDQTPITYERDTTLQSSPSLEFEERISKVEFLSTTGGQ